MLSFNLIYNLEAVAARPKIFMGLALVHFQKYWLSTSLEKSHFLPFDCLFQKTVIAYQLIHVHGAEMHLMILEMKKTLSKKQK